MCVTGRRIAYPELVTPPIREKPLLAPLISPPSPFPAFYCDRLLWGVRLGSVVEVHRLLGGVSTGPSFAPKHKPAGYSI